MIENIELLAFIKDNLSLARTIVIKNEDLAVLDNNLMYQYQKLTPSSDKSQWRYYLNLNGEYHSTDEKMYVRSLDDNENIEFTKANLELHPATKKAYRLGSYYFSRLVALYPHQMELIQGIINPIPPEESIPAKNYQILRYTKDYVLWNESQLIPELQKHIDNVVYQSFSTEYKYTDDLMLPLLIAHLHETIFKFLLQCRFENRQTRHAHSFYIWSYLQSKGISPVYKDLLNNKQTMWLFRNIDYVLRNVGKKSTFKQLIDILLSERNIPIAKYDLIQSTENMSTNLLSEPLFYSERLNLIETRGLGQSINKLAITMLKEVPEALDNEVYYDMYLADTEYDFTFGEVNSFPTKILDSELVDTTNRKPETIFHVLNSELIYLSGKNLYNINLDIEDPLSGIHRRISIKDAVVLWHHLLNSYNGASCDAIPQFYYKDVLKITPPTVTEMLSVGAKPFLTEAWCKDALKLYIPQIRTISPSIFYENSLAIFNLKWKHKKMYSRWLSIGYYSRRKNAISTMYESGYMKLTDKTSYAEFLEQYDFDFSSYRKEDYFALMWEIWKKATGWDQYTHITVAQIQEGMIGLMKFLSSYTVQYIHQTKVEDGWYEGGLDLFTENPSILNPNREDGQPELENDVESSRIPVHHRVVMIKNEEEETFTLDKSIHAGTISSELEEDGFIYETPKLYKVELADTDKDDGFHSSQVMDIDYKLRNFTGKLPYDLEDLIPKGGDKYNQHTLKELIVDTFEGISKVGPWEAIGIKIVNNKIDNENVADQVENYPYDKILETKNVDDTTNRYYVGFSPKDTGEHVIKLDIIIRNTETEELNTLRFDYNTVTKQNTWAISFEIPKSITLNVPFTITPTITGLTLEEGSDIQEKYIVNDEISEFLTIGDTDGKLTGTFLKEGWPEELPVLYVITTTQGEEDPESTTHSYFMKGLIPSDRYYDPLTDTAFDPKIKYNEADINAIVLENFSVSASSHGWEVTNLYLKKDDTGKYPEGQVKTDYNGIVDFLSPTLSDRKFVDETVSGQTIRTFEWYYAAGAEEISLTMVLELTNKDDGSVVLKEFTYAPTVVDHGAKCELNITPEDGRKFGINYPTATSLAVVGLRDTITLTAAQNPVMLPDQTGKVAIDYSPKEIIGNRVYDYVVKPYEKISQDLQWAIKLQGTTKAINGEELTLLPYSTITVLNTDVIDYDELNTDDIKVLGWENSTIYAHAVVPTRYAVGGLANGWYIEKFDLVKPNGQWPEFVGLSLPGLIPTDAVTLNEPSIVYGKDKDGPAQTPEGYSDWFTVYMLGNRDFLGEEEVEIAIPITASLKNEYTEKTLTVTLNPKNQFTGKPFAATRNPLQLLPETDNTLSPVWEGIPLSQFESVQSTSSGIFLGTNKYVGSNGYGSETTFSWEADTNQGHLVMPEAPISKGNGIRVYNERVYKSTRSDLVNGSLENVIYYPYVDYTPDDIIRVPVPTLEDMDFVNIGNVNFYQGVRSSYVTLFNYARLNELNWKVSSVNLEAYGSEEQDEIMVTTVNDVDLSEYLYEGSTRANAVNDAPEGKEGYHSAYVSFAPAKAGKQTFTVLVKVTTATVNDIAPILFKHEIEIDVNEHEGEVVYDSSYPDPDWVIGETNYVLTDVEGISDKVINKSIHYSTVNENDKAYISSNAKSNPTLQVGLSLSVNVPKQFTGVTPNVIVIENVNTDGYATTDPRRKRYYYGILPIKADKLYNLDDITLDTIEFKEDIGWENKRVNESYYDRYVYNIESRGWTVKTAGLIENSEWMNNYFESSGKLIRNTFLINTNKYNYPKDLVEVAPEGKQFYLPFYGSRKEGVWPTKINVVIFNKHLNGGKTKTLTYSKDITYVQSDIKLNFTNKNFVIGKNNELIGGMEGVPSEDIRVGMIKSSETFTVDGTKKSFFTPYQNPYRLNIKDSYEEGSGDGIRLMIYQLYAKIQTGWVVRTYTWHRGYRGQQDIDESQIIHTVDYPEVSDFDFSYLKDGLMQGASCSIPYGININNDVLSQWNVKHNGLTSYGTENQDNIMISKVEGKDIPSKYVHSVNDSKGAFTGLPTGKEEYEWKFLKFIPAYTGTQKFEISLTLSHKTSTTIEDKDYTFVIEANVIDNPTVMMLDERSTNVYWLIGDTTKAYTKVAGITDTVVKDDIVEAIPTGNDLAYLVTSVTSSITGINNSYMNVMTVRSFDGVNRKVMIVHSVVRSDYPETDNRSNIDYIGHITIEADKVRTINQFDGAFINLNPVVIFEQMDVNQSYVEKYTYDIGTDDWKVTNIRLVSDTEFMNHYFEYEGSTFTNAQLLGLGGDRTTYDRNEKAPEGKYFFLPMYGSRKEGEYDISFTITVSNSIYTKNKNFTFKHTFKRKFVDAGILTKFNFTDQLTVNETTGYNLVRRNTPTSDLTPGVISNNTIYKLVGPYAGYFTLDTSKRTMKVDAAYPVQAASGLGVLIAAAYIYRAVTAGSPVTSETQFRAYRGEYIIGPNDVAEPNDYTLWYQGIDVTDTEVTIKYLLKRSHKDWPAIVKIDSNDIVAGIGDVEYTNVTGSSKLAAQTVITFKIQRTAPIDSTFDWFIRGKVWIYTGASEDIPVRFSTAGTY